MNSGNTAQDEDATVEDSKGTFYLDGEVDVAGCVDDVDVGVFPLAEGGGTLDGDALFAFQVHAVHLGAHSIFSTYIVNCLDSARVE